MKELKYEELSIKQKLGMVMAGIVRPIRCEDKYETFDENFEFVLDLIRNHSLGAVWVPVTTLTGVAGMFPGHPDVIDKIREAADYPILIFTDAESGMGDHQIGRHNALGATGSEDLAYIFGKVTGITARKMGYNVVCDPVVDMVKDWVAVGGNIRSLGSDKHKVSSLAKAEARGLKDAGVLTVAKHYPSAGGSKIDGHMAPTSSHVTKEELIDYNLFPYTELMKEGLLDGIMAGHTKLANIDPEYPTSVSEKAKNIIRELGFDGFFITDALDMMGLKAQFGDTNVKGLCVESGIEFILPWFSAKKAYYDLCDCYEKGIITNTRLDEAVKTVLAAQHKVMNLNPKFEDITDKDIEMFDRINRDGIYARTDDGLDSSISKDGKHFFAMLVRNETDIADDGKVSVDTFTNGWWYPAKITQKLEKLFPNSTVRAISQFPSPNQNMDVLQDSVDYDDVVFLTFAEAPAYAGSDHLTHRIVALINALQLSGKLSTIAHFGNPYPLEELNHVPRILIGGVSPDSINAGLEVLAGKYEAKGVLTYDVNFQ
ncbi:MAG: hypothetical protein IKJ68_04675 [Clostridia bacterium]|nr:hypothetical protein [Clostridia bacterium]